MQTGLYLIELAGGTTHIIESNLSNNIYPNPAKNYINITTHDANNLILYNTLGTKIKSIQINSEQTTIKRDNLANGLYFYNLLKDNKKISSGKILFE